MTYVYADHCDPDYHMGKPSSKRFQLRFSAHHKGLIKANENQSIITKKFNSMFWEKKLP